MMHNNLRHNKLEDVTSMEPGARLRYAREAAGVAQLDVANRLRLSVKTIAALEAGDYSQLAGPTFVKGYLRSYAQLFNITLDNLNINLPEPSLIANTNPESTQHHYKKQITMKDLPMRWLTYLIIAVLLVLVLIAWHNQNPSKTEEIIPESPITSSESEQLSIMQPVGYDAKVPMRGTLTDEFFCSLSFTFCSLNTDKVVLVD